MTNQAMRKQNLFINSYALWEMTSFLIRIFENFDEMFYYIFLIY